MIYLRLFIEFFKTGLFSVGGGMATIPFLQDMSRATGWFTSAQLADMIAVAESTPGPLGVNTATYVGFTVGTQEYGMLGGILGAVVATVGLVTPSIIVFPGQISQEPLRGRGVLRVASGFRGADWGGGGRHRPDVGISD